MKNVNQYTRRIVFSLFGKFFKIFFTQGPAPALQKTQSWLSEKYTLRTGDGRINACIAQFVKAPWKLVESLRVHGIKLTWDKIIIRVKNDVYPAKADQDVVRFKQTGFADVSSKRISVLIHGFYDDLIRELLDYTKNIESNYDILITTVNEKGDEAVRSWKKENKFAGDIFLKRAPKKGRDLAPALISFRDEVVKYDYICKIHTKKSLYTGKEQSEWRNALINPLLGSKENVNNILDLFENNKKMGLVYPESTMFPYWVYTWLSNRHSGQILINKLNLSVKPDGYIDYPLGSMFWFRPQAVKQLFSGVIGIDDFHEEPIPNDGTMAHALERIFALLSLQNNYTYSEINVRDKLFYIGYGTKNLQQYTSKTFESLLASIDRVDIVSFDIFDTLINRPLIHPDKIFDIVEQKLNIFFEKNTNFKVKRKESEHCVRKKLKREVDFDDIYKEAVNSRLMSDEVAEAARKLEYDLERALTMPRKPICAAFDYAKEKKRVILVSDTYLKKDQVSALLEGNGIKGYHELYVSSDVKKRKDDSSMWHYLIEKEKLKDNTFLHIGDNEHSDIQLSGDLELDNYHIMSAKNMFANSALGEDYIRKYHSTWDADEFLGPIINSLYIDPFIGSAKRKVDKELLNPEQVGFCVFGPLIFYFFIFLFQQIKINGNNRVYFFAREGYFLKRIYDQMVKLDIVKETFGTLPPSNYLIISRRAVLGAVEKSLSIINEILINNTFEGTVDEFFYSRIGVKMDKIDGNFARKYIKLPDDRMLIKNKVAQYFDTLNQASKNENTGLLWYLEKSEFINKECSPAVVDLGYSATTQRYLFEISKQKMDGYYFITRESTNNWASEQNKTFGCFFDQAKDTSDNPVFKFSLFLEAWLSSPQGQLNYFEVENGISKPHFKDVEPFKKYFEINEEIADGVINYITTYSKILSSDLCIDSVNMDKVLTLYGLFVKHNLWDTLTRKIFFIDNAFCGLDSAFDIVKHYEENVLKNGSG